MSKTTHLRELLEDNTIAASPALARKETDGRGNRAVRCVACGHRCLIREGRAGVCCVRFVRDGELRAPGGYVAGLQVDPIEKKPFYHAYPGRDALSFGMLGCDLHCAYCQNWVSSQALRDDEAVAMPRFCDASELVDLAVSRRIPVMVSTYNEPLITADWAASIFEPACERGIVCGFVSNGNATPEALEFLRPFVKLYKVDLKCFNDRNYRQLGCTLSNVLKSIEGLKALGFWVEVVTLVVPGFNDSGTELRQIAEFLAGVSPDIPWHVTAFHPDYRMTGPRRTSVDDLDRAWQAGKAAGLHFVYAGNLPGMVGGRENTFCPSCGATLIERHGFYILRNLMDGGRCPDCQTVVAGIWEAAPPRTSDGAGAPRAIWF